MTCRRHSPGFTLLEVTLALTLSIMLVGGMLGLYDHATSIRRSVIEHTERITSVRIVMDRLTNELRGAMAYPFLNFGMEGSDGELEFITASLPGPAVWAVRKSTEDPIPPETDLEMVGYRLRTHEDEEGFIVVDGLGRTSQKILAAPTAEEGSEIDAVLLTEHVKFLQFAYFDGEQWTNLWNEGGLPLAVEVTIGLEPLPEDAEPQDYPFEKFRRTVYVPGGKNSRRGTIVRGLGR